MDIVWLVFDLVTQWEATVQNNKLTLYSYGPIKSIQTCRLRLLYRELSRYYAKIVHNFLS